jgi:hypothetical protein
VQSWLGHKLISFVMGRTRAGDVRPTLLLDHPDVPRHELVVRRIPRQGRS